MLVLWIFCMDMTLLICVPTMTIWFAHVNGKDCSQLFRRLHLLQIAVIHWRCEKNYLRSTCFYWTNIFVAIRLLISGQIWQIHAVIRIFLASKRKDRTKCALRILHKAFIWHKNQKVFDSFGFPFAANRIMWVGAIAHMFYGVKKVAHWSVTTSNGIWVKFWWLVGRNAYNLMHNKQTHLRLKWILWC